MNKLKNIKLSFAAMLALSLTFSTTFVSCDDDNDNETPVIHYVRSTNPQAKDSLMEKVTMGSVIAIMGENLTSVRELYFNDVAAKLNSSYITNGTIIVTVPPKIWTKQNDSITMIANSGEKVMFYCPVAKNSPKVTEVSLEYPLEGDEIIIKGSGFFNDEDKLAVELPGVGEVPVISNTETEIKVKVPAGVTKGQIRVTSAYGSGKSTFNMYEDEGFILDFETPFNGWGKHKTDVDNTNPYINTFVHFSGKTALWGWTESATVLYSFASEGFSWKAPEDNGAYALKFECRVNNVWSLVGLYIHFYEKKEETNNGVKAPCYNWEPWKDGEYGPTGWVTVTIPISSFNQTENGSTAESSASLDNIGGLYLFLRGGSGSDEKTEQEIDMDLDNFRIVKY